MKEVFFDIKKYSYIKGDNIDVSFIPMLIRRKLDLYGRAALYTLYKVYDNESKELVFASCYGDVDRVIKLIKQRQTDGEVSPSGFSSSVHNAAIGLFTLLEKNKKSYNSISAGKESVSAGLLESIMIGYSIFCYSESLGGVESVAISIERNNDGAFCLSENSEDLPAKDGFDDLVKFLDGESDLFVSRLYTIRRLPK